MLNLVKLLVFIVMLYSPILLAASCSKDWWNPLSYQNRGDRCEGIIPRQANNRDIELISALINTKALPSNSSIPDYYQLKFYLPTTREIYIKAEELEPKHYYRLDNVIPPNHWNKGVNTYSWSTTDVIQAIDNFNVSNLGIVIRSKNSFPTVDEYIIPTFFYYSNPPKKIQDYQFVLLTNRDAELNYTVVNEQNKQIKSELIGFRRANKPFPIKWHMEDLHEGYYKFIVKGQFVDDGTNITQMITFYHKPNF